jgi:oligopeptide transport system substrate-binding protein
MKRLLALLMALMLIALAVPMAAGAEAAEKKLVFQMSGEPECMDPTMNDYSGGSYALQSLFRGLYKFAEDGSLVPALAEGYTVSADGLVYTFTLKKDLKWSDGSPLTAKDFEYSWKRVLNPDLASETAYTLYGVIKNGYECFVDKTKTMDDVGVKALDDVTLEVTLIAPAPYFVSMTASTAFLPVKKEIIDTYGEDWETKVESYVCNGPFMVKELKPQEKYVFVKNPNYYNASEVKLDTLEYIFLEDSATALLAFENGEVNIASSVSADAEAKYKGTPSLVVSDRAGFRYYEFNCANAPVSDARVRKALSLAIDRKILTESVIQSSLPPLYGFIPHKFPDLVDPSKTWRDVHGDAFKEDVAAAKQLLADAGYPDGAGFPKIRLLQTSNATLVKTAEAMAQMWKQNLNIDTEIVSVESATYFSDGYARDAGDFEVCYMGYTGDYLDPSSLFYNFESTGSTKSTRWVNADYDAIMAKVRAGAAGAEREKLIEEAEALLANEFPIMPVYSYTSLALVSSNVTGFTRNYIGHPNFEYCDIVAK